MTESADLLELAQNFAEVLAKECAEDRLMGHIAAERLMDRALWSVVVDLGWIGLQVPVEQGGVGLGLDALIVLYRELGKVLAPVPLLSTLLAADAVQKCGSVEQCARWLPRIMSGKTIAAIALQDSFSAVVGKIEGDDVILHGESGVTPDASLADLLICQILIEETPHLILVESGAEYMSVAPIVMADQTRAFARLSFSDCRVPAGSLLSGSDVNEVLRSIRNHAMAAIAADAVGGAEAILDKTLAYLKVREQFGRVIGSFQALKHRIADHKSELLMAQTLVEEVARRLTEGDALTSDVLAVKALATKMYASVARDCIQLHGGIGFTWDYPAHLYLKRSLLDRELFGSLASTLDELARGLAA